ncbi:MAG: histidine kinase [Lentimicrobiaceae bacterium]|jgi:sensor histidine kinase YesM
MIWTIGIAVVLGSWVVYLLIRLHQEQKKTLEAKKKFEEIEYQLDNIKLETIESRINPHLLKNILNSIQSHVYQSYYAIDKLANVLDYILYDSHKQYVTPKEEVDFIVSLIEINKIKLSPLFELKVKLKIHENEPMYLQRYLVPLISVELVENAFKHADLQSPDSFISVTVSFNDSIFSLTVANKISAKEPMKKEKSGIGDEIMEQRLKIIYKENYTLDKFVEDNVYIAHLKINLLEHKAKMLAIG